MSESTPIIVLGAAGRMGRMILDCAGNSEDPFSLVGALEYSGHPAAGQPLRTLIPGAPEDVILAAEMPESPPEGTVVIDFTVPASTLAHLPWAETHNTGVVIGTTGFDDAGRARIAEAGKRIPVLFAPNMSVGVNMLFELVRQAIKMAGSDFDIEIIEMHHRFKKDAPSGTAARLSEIALEARGGRPEDIRHGREGIVGERTPTEIGMHALRGGAVVGDHTVVLASLGERIELTHRAHTRETFARGALRAAKWLSGRAPGLYGMKDVLGM